MTSMPIAAHLLGPPVLMRDGVVYAAPRGRKVWALLTYLAQLLRGEYPRARIWLRIAGSRRSIRRRADG